MHEVLIRFKIVKDNKYLEVAFDSRLSFKENLKILSELINENYEHMKVYDAIKKIFLDMDIAISEFNINYFISLQLF